MSDGHYRSPGRRAQDQLDLAVENAALRATVASLEAMVELEQALRRARETELRILHQRIGAAIDESIDAGLLNGDAHGG